MKSLLSKYGYNLNEEEDILLVSLHVIRFQQYIEQGLKVCFEEWLRENTLEIIDTYLDYYLTH